MVRLNTATIAATVSPDPLSITGYTNVSVLSPTSSLSMTCQTCGGVPAPVVQWVTSVGNVVINETSVQDVGTGCTSLTLHYDEVGQHLTNREVLTCRLEDGSHQTNRMIAIEGNVAKGGLHFISFHLLQG